MAEHRDKWLIASDIDGTLITLSRHMPEENIKSINDFVSNGNYFTLCSGRNLQSLEPHYKKCGANAPAVFLNGAGIYDFGKDELLSYTVFTPSQEDYIIELIEKYTSLLDFVLYEPRKIHIIGKNNLLGTVTFLADGIDKMFHTSVRDVPRGCWGKLSFMPRALNLAFSHIFGQSAGAVCLAEVSSLLCGSEIDGGFECFPEHPTLKSTVVEVAPGGVNKGSGIKKLAELLNVGYESVGAIGDSFNDCKMLEAVTHAAYCGDSAGMLSKYCEFNAKPCKDGAVSDFLNYINNKYLL